MDEPEPFMENNLTPRLWIGTSAIIALVASFVLVGTVISVLWLLVTSLALAAWILLPSQDRLLDQGLITPYLLAIILSLMLATSHYWSGIPSDTGGQWWAVFAPRLPVSDRMWFVVFVTLPVCLLMFGGYALLERHTVRSFFAWWAFLYAIAQSVLQLYLEFGPLPYVHHAYVGTMIASALLIVGISGCSRLLGRTRLAPLSSLAPPVSARTVNRWSGLFVCLILIYGASLYAQAGFLPVAVILASMAGGLMAWRRTTATYPATPLKVVPLYLLLQMLFFLHVGEETLTSFNQSIAAITGVPWQDRSFTFPIGLIGPAIWMLGALSLWRRQPFGNFMLWFMVVGMIIGEPTHLLVFPFLSMHQTGSDYRYFSGMYTALLPMVPAILALKVIMDEHRQRKKRTE